MRDTHSSDLTSECIALHRYLAGTTPSKYVVEKYAQAHEHVPALRRARGWFDVLLLRASHLNQPLLAVVQAYTRIFAPTALVRSKAVLLFALVECCGPTLAVVQSARAQGPLRAMLASMMSVAGFALSLLAAVLIFGPLHLISAAGVSVNARLAGRRSAVREAA